MNSSFRTTPSASPNLRIRHFSISLQTTYEAAANLAGWDRNALERREDPNHAV